MTDSWSPDFGLLQAGEYLRDENQRRLYHSPVFDSLKLGAAGMRPRHPIIIRPGTAALCAARVRRLKLAKVFNA